MISRLFSQALRVLFLPLLSFGVLHAAVLDWTNGGATNNWSDADNWSSGSVPGTADSVEISNSYDIIVDKSATIGHYYDNSPNGSLTIGDGTSSVTLGFSDSSDGTFRLGSVAAAEGEVFSLYIKNNATLAGTKTGDPFSIDKQVIILGWAANSNVYTKVEAGGTIKLNTPTFLSNYTVSRLMIGGSGNAEMDVDGGTVDVGNIMIANSPGSTGKVNVTSGIFKAKYMLSVGNLGGDASNEGPQGILNISGGTVSTAQLYAGQNALSSGSTGVSGKSVASGVINVTNGTLTASSKTLIGYSGDGELNVSGGSASLGSLKVGYAQTHEKIKATGVINITGGTVTSGNAYLAGGTGEDTSTWVWYDKSGTEGTMKISGGSYTSSGTVYVGHDGDGKVYISGTGSFAANAVSLGYNTTGTGLLEIQKVTGSLYRNNGTTLTTISGNNGKGIVRFNYAGAMNFENVMSGTNLRVEHVNKGVTTLSGGSSYAGGTLLSAGVIIASNQTAIGSGLLEVKGGTLNSAVSSISTGSIEMTSGAIGLIDNSATVTTLTGSYAMSGGNLQMDIISTNVFDAFAGNGGALALTGGTLTLSGYQGYEGVLGVEGYEYAIFSGFEAMGEEIVDGGVITINGYDKSNWLAKIKTDGTLYFVTRPIPEPSSVLLFGLASAVMAARRKR